MSSVGFYGNNSKKRSKPNRGETGVEYDTINQKNIANCCLSEWRNYASGKRTMGYPRKPRRSIRKEKSNRYSDKRNLQGKGSQRK